MTSETDGKKGMGIAYLLRHPVAIVVSLFATFELGVLTARSYSEAPVPDAASCVDFCDTRGGVKSFSYRLAEPADARRGPQPNANTSCVCLNGASISKDPSPKDSRLPMITTTSRTLTQDDREKLAKVLAHVNSKVDPGWELFDDPVRDGLEHAMKWRRRDGASFCITKPWRKERWFEIRPDYPSVELSNGRRVSTDPYAYDDAKGCRVYVGLEARARVDRPSCSRHPPWRVPSCPSSARSARSLDHPGPLGTTARADHSSRPPGEPTRRPAPRRPRTPARKRHSLCRSPARSLPPCAASCRTPRP